MGGVTPTLSSTAGPAKWAAVIVLAFASGAGLTWSAVRGRAPTAVQAIPERSLPPPRPAPSAQPVPAPTQAAPQPISKPPAEPPGPVEQTPAPATPAPQPIDPPPPATPLPGAPAKAPGLTHRININTAPQPELELLPGVGPAMAKKIMDYRTLHGPFKAISDLDKVKGIGPKTLAKIAPLVTIE